jgi:hypothetical protein
MERWSIGVPENHRPSAAADIFASIPKATIQEIDWYAGRRVLSPHYSITPTLHHSNTPFPLLPCIQPLFACVEQAIFRARSQRIDAPRLGSILACLATRYENQESTS